MALLYPHYNRILRSMANHREILNRIGSWWWSITSSRLRLVELAQRPSIFGSRRVPQFWEPRAKQAWGIPIKTRDLSWYILVYLYICIYIYIYICIIYIYIYIHKHIHDWWINETSRLKATGITPKKGIAWKQPASHLLYSSSMSQPNFYFLWTCSILKLKSTFFDKSPKSVQLFPGRNMECPQDSR